MWLFRTYWSGPQVRGGHSGAGHRLRLLLSTGKVLKPAQIEALLKDGKE